jgi:hypothetical protein
VDAIVLPGRLALVADHLVLALRDDLDTPGGSSAGQPSFVLSWYAVQYAAAAPAGNLAFVRSAALPDGEVVLTDSPGLDAALRARLRPRSWPLTDPDRPATPATFEQTGVRDRALDALIVAGDTVIRAAWRDLGEPIVATGRVGTDQPWDTSTVLIEGSGWDASVDGRVEAGDPFPNDVWIGWFGRPLSSALVAVAEVFREATT